MIRTSGLGFLFINLEWIGFKYYKLSIGIDNLCNRNYREHLNLFHDK